MNEVHTGADKPKRNEWKVVLILVMSLLLLEGLVRNFAGSLSLDLLNIIATPRTSARITAAPEEVRTVLVVGNSLSRSGVDLKQLSEGGGWAQDGKKTRTEAELFAPDGSSVVQWNWGVKRYFANRDAHPDVILLFTGRMHLLDLPVTPETLGAYFVGPRDLPAAARSMRDGDDSLSLLLGATSHLLANKDRVRTRIGYSYLPGFEAAWPVLTSGGGAAATQTEPSQGDGGDASDAGTVEALKGFIATARQMGSELHVISVPMPEGYQVAAPVRRLLEKEGIPLHDLSVVPGITPDLFPDHYHLGEAGAKLFTGAILDSLKKRIPASPH